MRRVLSWPAISVLLVVCLAAAAIPEAETTSWEGQTFLADYSSLKPILTKTGREYVYAMPGIEERLAAYGAVMVDQPPLRRPNADGSAALPTGMVPGPPAMLSEANDQIG